MRTVPTACHTGPAVKEPTMHIPELALAILALLVTPGPTNTLMLLSGADRGFRATLRLVPLELAAYLCTVVPLLLLAQLAAPTLAMLRPAIAVVAGLWVLVLALRLWRTPDPAFDGPAVTARAIAVTTLLNPKAMIFGIVLLPQAPATVAVPLFCTLVVLTALVWAALGSHSPLRHGAGLPPALRRAAACWLGFVSLGLLAKALA